MTAPRRDAEGTKVYLLGTGDNLSIEFGDQTGIDFAIDGTPEQLRDLLMDGLKELNQFFLVDQERPTARGLES